MHELGVVQSLVEQLSAEVERLGVGGRVRKVHLKLGALTTFVPEAMTFYYDALTPGTPLEGSALAVEEVGVTGACRACGRPFALEAPPFVCPHCGAPDIDVQTGRELLINTIDVADEDER